MSEKDKSYTRWTRWRMLGFVMLMGLMFCVVLVRGHSLQAKTVQGAILTVVLWYREDVLQHLQDGISGRLLHLGTAPS